METYIYFNKKLINKRKKLRLTISDAAKTLTLSTTQIKSLENNLDIGFASPKYKLILLKRYAKLLDIELEDLIENEDRSNLEKENKPPAQKTNSALHNKVNYSVLAIILFGLVIYFFNTDLSKSKNKILDLNEVTPEPDTLSIEIHEEEYIEITDNLSESLGSSEQISDNDDEYNQLDSQLNEEPITIADDVIAPTELDSTSEIIAFNSDEDFVCKVGTTQLKSFSTQNPEKPSYYFYIISHDSQKICVVDSLGALKEYDLKKGGKLSHHGSPPFKIQLNPNVSEVYFEGWKVNLQDNDYFIQLNPALTP
ncbi:helix-turn-helix domain-containing protein [Methylophilaceae bacterium]|nr:helix-turn-helix domain-containing protein [Methylophilaceae bacterium]